MNSKFENILIKILRLTLVITTAAMLVILAIVVGMRYGFHRDFYGYNEIVLADSFWMYFIGAAFAMRQEEHIKADILKNFVSEKCAATMKVIAGILQTTVNYAMIVLSYNLVMSNFKAWTITPLWEIPFFVSQISILISFILMAYYLTIYTIRDYNELISLTEKRN